MDKLLFRIGRVRQQPKPVIDNALFEHVACCPRTGEAIAQSNHLIDMLHQIMQDQQRALITIIEESNIEAGYVVTRAADALPLLSFEVGRFTFTWDRLSMPVLIARWQEPRHKIFVCGLVQTFQVDALAALPVALARLARNPIIQGLAA